MFIYKGKTTLDHLKRVSFRIIKILAEGTSPTHSVVTEAQTTYLPSHNTQNNAKNRSLC
jgi:hypothetical protein